MENQRRIYTEVYSILNLLGEDYINKLPKSLYSMIEKNNVDTNNLKYKSIDELNKDNVLKASISMIAIFHLNYWCESVEEKNELKLLLQDNAKNNESKKRQKYNPNDIFKRKNIIEEENSLVPIQEEKWYKKVINFIKKLFIF